MSSSKWIQTSERLPELTHVACDYCGYEFKHSDAVICVYEGRARIGKYCGEDGWCLREGDQRYVTGDIPYWMPLPEPPKEAEPDPKKHWFETDYFDEAMDLCRGEILDRVILKEENNEAY